MSITWDDVREFNQQYLLPFGVKLLLAIAIFIVGRWISKAILAALDRIMARGKLDVSLRKFLGDVAYAVMFVVVVIASLDTIGLKTTAVVAVLGAAGLAVGLALQGSLSNFAAGVMLIMLRPYKVGDAVVIGKYLGRVDVIKVFNTVLVTADHREVTIPNATIIAAPIENLTALGHRRVDLIVTITGATTIDRAKGLLQDVLANDERVKQQPPATVDVAEVSDAGVKLYLRPWVAVDSYQQVAADTMERVKEAMESAGLKYSVQLQVPTA
ncbi:MAG TPA: mechanosensitive ion channel domain-containing protein [Kofleriaceae bacterium]|nr:mechanosensitive ion channel domain-containing protein [Kofleriaceae bacterium]